MIIKGKNWPQDFPRRFFIGMHTVDCDQNATIPGLLSQMDARDIIKRLADAGVNAVYFYSSCHCGNCFYPTETPRAHMHSALDGRDVFGEAADECQKRGMAFIAVYEYMHLRLRDSGPPEWRHYYPSPAEGKNSTGGYCGLCWNTGYGDFIEQQLTEVCSRYPVAGVYVDMLNHPGLACCEGCARRFKQQAGIAPPRLIEDTPRYKAFKLWMYEEEARYLRELRRLVQAYQPEATLINNILLFRCEDLYEIPDANDYITHDTGMVFGSKLGSVQRDALNAVYRALSRGKKAPFETLTDPILYGVSSVPPADVYNAVTSVTRLQGGIAGYPSGMLSRTGGLHPPTLGLTKQANEFLNARIPWRAEGEPVRFLGLYLSQESEIFYANLDPRKPDNKAYLDSFLGAYLAAQQEHLPTDVLTRRDLTRLKEYPVLVLANAVCMSDAEAAAMRDYVKAGGTLLATFETSTRNEWSELRSNFALADMFGVDSTGRTLQPFNALQMPLPSGLFPLEDWEKNDMAITAPGLICRMRPGTETIAHLHDRYRYDPDKQSSALHNAYTMLEPAGPGVVQRQTGKGRCVYCSAKIFEAYLHSGVPTLRKLILRWLIAPEISEKCLVRLIAPSSVEMTAWAQADQKRILMNMVNYQSAPGRLQTASGLLPLTEDVMPACNVKLKIRFRPDQIEAAVLQPEGQKLTITHDDNGAVVVIPVVKINDIVEICLKPGVCPEYPECNKATDYIRMDWRSKVADWLKTSPPEYDSRDSGALDFKAHVPDVRTDIEKWDGMGAGQV